MVRNISDCRLPIADWKNVLAIVSLLPELSQSKREPQIGNWKSAIGNKKDA
jgi:hypothetical protein